MAAKTSNQLMVDEKKQVAKISKIKKELDKEKQNLVKLKLRIKSTIANEKAKAAKAKAALKAAAKKAVTKKKSVKKKSAKKTTVKKSSN